MQILKLTLKSILWMPILLICLLLTWLHIIVSYIFRIVSRIIKYLMDRYFDDLKESSINTPFENVVDEFLKRKDNEITD